MTRSPRGLPARRFIRALEADGFALQRVRGSHRSSATLTGVASSLPFIPLAKPFLSARRAMIEDAGWEDEDLERRGLIE
jgi:hypothetical protein